MMTSERYLTIYFPLAFLVVLVIALGVVVRACAIDVVERSAELDSCRRACQPMGLLECNGGLATCNPIHIVVTVDGGAR